MEEALHQSNVFKSIIHPQFNHDTLENDLALLLIENQLRVSLTVLPVCLPSSKSFSLPMTATIIGYESTGDASQMRAADVSIISRQKCLDANANFYGEYLNGEKFCAGSVLHEICSHDLGGGLYAKREDSWMLLGITSMVNHRTTGENSCVGPALITDIRNYLTWIVDVLSSD